VGHDSDPDTDFGRCEVAVVYYVECGRPYRFRQHFPTFLYAWNFAVQFTGAVVLRGWKEEYHMVARVAEIR
jgi:hypothetical protein